MPPDRLAGGPHVDRPPPAMNQARAACVCQEPNPRSRTCKGRRDYHAPRRPVGSDARRGQESQRSRNAAASPAPARRTALARSGGAQPPADPALGRHRRGVGRPPRQGMACRHARPPLRDPRTDFATGYSGCGGCRRQPPAKRALGRHRSGADERRRGRRHAAGSRRGRLGRPGAVFQRHGDPVSQGVAGSGAGPRRGPSQWQAAGHAAGLERRRCPHGASRSAEVSILQPQARHPRRHMPTVHAEGADPAARGGTAPPLHPRRDPAVHADAPGRRGRTRAPQTAAIHGRQHPVGAGRCGDDPARLQDGAPGCRPGAGPLPRAALGGRHSQGSPRHRYRHGHHCDPARRDGEQTAEPLDCLLRPSPGRIDDQPRGPRQRGTARPHAPDHRRLPAADRAACRRGRDARLDQSQARAVHAHSGALGDPRLVDLLAACLPAALPALGRLEQADGGALRHALRHPRREGLLAGIAGARPLPFRQRSPPPLAAMGRTHQHHLCRLDADRVRSRRADRLVRRWAGRDRRPDDAGPTDRLPRLPGDVLCPSGCPLELHDLADELSLGQPAGAGAARHAGPDHGAKGAGGLGERPRGDPLSGCHVRLRPQPAGAPRRVVRRAAGGDGGDRGAERLRQDHARQPAVAISRRAGGKHHGRRHRHPRPVDARPAREAGRRLPGIVPLPGHDLEKPLLRPTTGDDRAGPRGREGGRRPRLSLPPAAGLRNAPG